MGVRWLEPEQRDAIASDAAERYQAGEAWADIGSSYGITGAHVRRLTVARHDVTFRRWGQRPVADVEEVCRRRDRGESLDAIATALDCSREAIRTALERAGRTPQTRYPRLSARRSPTEGELERIAALYEGCPEAPRSRPGFRHVRGDEGRLLAEACRELVVFGVPMATPSTAIGRGPTWVH